MDGVPLAAAFEAISRMDADALVSVCDPDINFESRITAVEDAKYRGHAGVRRYIANLAEAFDSIEVTHTDVIEGDGVLVLTNCFRARGRGSGVAVQHDYFCAARAKDGRLTWWAFFDSVDEAIAAVGLTK